MVTRRGFPTALLGAAALSKTAFGQGADLAAAAVPPAIAALKSRKSEASPISLIERRDRLERARVLMKENNINAICMIGGTSLLYFTGIRWWNSERLFTFVLPQKG
jgi:Xaa-Pro dipeptidase